VIEIREMVSEELDAVIAIHLKGLELELSLLNQIMPYKAVDHTGLPQLKQVLLRIIETGEGMIHVAGQGDSLTGYSLVTKKIYPVENPAVCGCITGIYIAEAARRQGIGRRLFDAAVAWLKREGVSYIELHHMINDARAAAFWRAMGFTPVQINCTRRI
jgi:GNAT superfamily N-acetyltransferase